MERAGLELDVLFLTSQLTIRMTNLKKIDDGNTGLPSICATKQKCFPEQGEGKRDWLPAKGVSRS